MNLYRLDYTDCGAAIAAREIVAAHDRAVRITRIGNSGRMRPVLIAHPNGTFTRP